MRTCLSPQSITPCARPLPCRVHGTWEENITTELAWLHEPLQGGTLLTLTRRGNRISTTRWCAYDDGPQGLRRVQNYLIDEILRHGDTYETPQAVA